MTASTASRLVIDAGVVYTNIDVDALEDGSSSTPVADSQASATLLGATRGGNTFTAGRTMREMEADGKLGPTKGFKRRQEVAATLQTNLLEVTSENLQQAFAGSVTTTTGSFDKITGGEVSDATYINNIALYGTYTSGSGDTDAVVVVLENVLAVEAPDLSLSDEDEVVMPVTFGAHFDPATPGTEPWSIYIKSA
ncbi:MAG: hypothetical protein RI554_08015 [Trueperaceae bacterium]|nr:hypothetical protein [Trueperaceae bacterium]